MTLPIELEKLKSDIQSQVESCGAELVDLSFRRIGGRSVLTVIADKTGGITLEDCADVNRSLSVFFDSLSDAESGYEFLQGQYFLEVNSPGLDRPLKTQADFSRVVGQTVRVLFQDERGGTGVAEGILESADDQNLFVKAEQDGESKKVKLASVIRGTRQIKFSKK